MTAAGYGHIRATDADREGVRSLLQAAYADGRLSWDEFDARSTALMEAKTYDQLSALTADLSRPVSYVVPRYQPAPVRPTNQLAALSLGFGLGGIVLPFAGGIIAIVCGHRARRQIRRHGESGDGMALAGLVLGYVNLSIWLLIAVLIAGAVAVAVPHH